MPEKGWAILTVRENTAETVKQAGRKRGSTVDELINELLNPSSRTGWSTCPICKARLKTQNLHEHLSKTHPSKTS
jgi:hypothetical protein